MESEFDRKVAPLLNREPRYSKDAYAFVAEAVSFSVANLPVRGHVSASELLDGIRAFAHSKFGAVSREVLISWGLEKEDDVGNVVYLLISVDLLSESEDDSQEEFNTGCDLYPKAPVIRSVRRKGDDLPYIDE